MNTMNVINKQVLELHSSFLKDFIDKLKVDVPEEVHTIIDEQLKTEQELIKLNIKNINKKNKKIIDKDTPKKPTKANCWRLFCAFKSKEFPDNTPSEKWALCSNEWKALKLTGEDKYWKDLADEHNRKISESEANTPEVPITPTKATPKKVASKKAETPPKANKAVPKKAVPKKTTPKAVPIIDEVATDDEDNGDDTPSDVLDDNINEQNNDEDEVINDYPEVDMDL